MKFYQTKAFLNKRVEIKKLAATIRELKHKLRNAQRNNEYTGSTRSLLTLAQGKFRHENIAFAVLKGRSRTAIERPAVGNEPNEAWIEKILAELNAAIQVELQREEIAA